MTAVDWWWRQPRWAPPPELEKEQYEIAAALRTRAVARTGPPAHHASLGHLHRCTLAHRDAIMAKFTGRTGIRPVRGRYGMIFLLRANKAMTRNKLPYGPQGLVENQEKKSSDYLFGFYNSVPLVLVLCSSIPLVMFFCIFTYFVIRLKLLLS